MNGTAFAKAIRVEWVTSNRSPTAPIVASSTDVVAPSQASSPRGYQEGLRIDSASRPQRLIGRVEGGGIRSSAARKTGLAFSARTSRLIYLGAVILPMWFHTPKMVSIENACDDV